MTYRRGRFDSQDPARQAKSAYFQDGAADGTFNAAQESACPPAFGPGKDPGKEFSYMYLAGWEATYVPVPCPCDGSCKKGKQYGEAPQ